MRKNNKTRKKKSNIQKKIILLVAVVVLLGALVIVFNPFTPSEPAASPSAVSAAAQSTAADNIVATPAVGSDRDDHGCIGSAGYTYSSVNGKCIRLWEAGIALTPVVQVADPVLAAYIVQDDGGQNVELFLPDVKDGILMSRGDGVEPPTWITPEGWELTYDPDQGWKLARDGMLLYASKAQ